MSLVFRLKHPPSIPLEVDGVKLETVREQPLDNVRRTPIQHGNSTAQLGEFFDVSGSAADNSLVWEGDCSRVKWIGAGMRGGSLRVEGDAGTHLGSEMRSGEITVNGDAGDYTGARLRGGRIRIRGNAGDLVGAHYPGERRGMSGGEILIEGNAGSELGRGMRRGLIAVAGETGEAAGYDMLAGSILLFGRVGLRPGAGMRRGTIGLFADTPPPELLPTFRFACTYQPTFLGVVLRELVQWGFPVSPSFRLAEYRRYCGDLLELGKGEILVRDSSEQSPR